MTFIKRRQRLIDRLGNIYDEDLLDKIEEIIDEKEGPDTKGVYDEDDVLHFSPELKGRIDAALEQMQNGQTYTEEEMDKYVSGVRVYEDRFEWLLNLSPDAGGGLDDAGSPVYFKKITVTPDDERAWFRKHPQWSKSNRYAELEVWIFI